MLNDPNFKHGDVYFSFSQNEDVGKAAMRMDMSYFDRTPDILIDVDGGDYGQFSKANFTAEGRTYLFKGNLAHTSHGKELKYADARTAMAYFIGQLPPDIHPSYSEGHQGYVHCYHMEMLPNGHDVRIRFRIRYFDKADGERYKAELDQAHHRTQEAYPFVEVVLENDELQYENVAYNMHPEAVNVIKQSAEKTGIPMEGVDLRAGTTGALMVAKGLPGGPCIYSAQQAEHSVFEWCCLEEMIDIVRLTRNIVTEVSRLK
jgi:tripeptide aminopeptidase